MPFHVGDRVFHPIHGVGQIETIEKKKFLNNIPRLYYQVRAEKSTVWVPVDAQQTVGLRLLTPKRDLERFRAILKSRPASLTDNHSKRHIEIASRLSDGSLEMMCQAVRDLAGRALKQSLSSADAASLRKARDRLYQEWAAAEGVSVDKATEEVEALLAQAHKSSK
jgi:CarD family transcriptional regulator